MAHNNVTVNEFEPLADGKINCGLTPIILIGRNLSQAYNTNPTTPTLGDGDALYFYDPNPINTIPNATISSSGGWVSSVTLPAGTYVMSMLFSFVFSASGSSQFGFKRGINYEGSLASCGGLKNVYLSGGGVSGNTQTLTSSGTYTFNTFASSNLAGVNGQGNIPSEQSYVLIQKVDP